jgi:hypothetical protein
MPTEPAYIEALKAYGSGEPTAADVRALETELYNGPDRGGAVVLSSSVERAVERLLRNHVRNEGASALFDTAPLSANLAPRYRWGMH